MPEFLQKSSRKTGATDFISTKPILVDNLARRVRLDILLIASDLYEKIKSTILKFPLNYLPFLHWPNQIGKGKAIKFMIIVPFRDLGLIHDNSTCKSNGVGMFS
jgi:hypothetical protein